MPKLTVLTSTGDVVSDVESGKRLVLAIEQDARVDIAHRCGGNARCTTCRVEFIEGEPDRLTEAEMERLGRDPDRLSKFRLACQIPCDRDMTVRPGVLVSEAQFDDPGGAPAEEITPEPVWTAR